MRLLEPVSLPIGADLAAYPHLQNKEIFKKHLDPVLIMLMQALASCGWQHVECSLCLPGAIHTMWHCSHQPHYKRLFQKLQLRTWANPSQPYIAARDSQTWQQVFHIHTSCGVGTIVFNHLDGAVDMRREIVTIAARQSVTPHIGVMTHRPTLRVDAPCPPAGQQSASPAGFAIAIDPVDDAPSHPVYSGVGLEELQLLRSQLAAARREIQWLLQQVGSPRSSGGGNQAEEQLRRENKSLLIEVEALRSIVQALRAVQIEPSSCDPPQPDVSQTRSQKHAAKKARIELQRDKVLLDISKGLDNIQDYHQTVKILHFCRDNRVEYDDAQDNKFRIGFKVQMVKKKSAHPSAVALATILLDKWAAEKKPEPR